MAVLDQSRGHLWSFASTEFMLRWAALTDRVLQATLAHLQPRPPPCRSPTVAIAWWCATRTSGASAAVAPTVSIYHGDVGQWVVSAINLPLAPRCHGPESDQPGANRSGIISAEVALFKANGFLVNRGVVPLVALARFVEQFSAEVIPP
jgi:hypothetical protein